MFKTLGITALLTTLAMSAHAQDSRIASLCGADHSNEVAGAEDVRANPDGYYIASLQEQLTLGDPRIIQTNDTDAYLCTRPAATPEMDATNAALNEDARVTRWLFVPAHPMGN